MSEIQNVGKCRVCDAEYSCHFYKGNTKIRRFMAKEHVCGTCASWMTRGTDPNATEEVIGGSVYRVYPYQDELEIGDFLGGRGQIRYIMKIDTLEVYRSNDVWEIGPPPPAFQMPDTAVFVERHFYRPLMDGPFVCQGRTCLDRYTCALYIKELTEPDGPANNIPKDWKDGDEHCTTYLNINKTNDLIMKWRKRKQ